VGKRTSDRADSTASSAAPQPFAAVELLWYGGTLILVSIPVALCVHAVASTNARAWEWPALAAIPLIVAAAMLLGAREVGPGRAAVAAASGAGVLVGVALALHAPAYWVSPDTAFHMAKVAVAADGHAWHDPIVRERTIYPFLYHWLLAWPVRAGAPLRDVMTAISAVAFVGTSVSFWWAARARLDPTRAAWAALALPLFFHAPTRAYMLLPDPSNLSWLFLFAGLGLLLRSETRPGVASIGAGAVFGAAGLIWYGHLPHLAILVLLLLVSHPKLAIRVAAGALPFALVFAIHLLAVSDAPGGEAIVAEGGEPLTDRLAAMIRNVLGLSGGAAWSEIPWWIGVLGIAMSVSQWKFLRSNLGIVLPRLTLAMGVCLFGSGLLFRYWEPFAWRYAYLFWVLLMLSAAAARPWRLAGRRIPATAIAAVLAVVLVPRWWLPVAWETERLSTAFEESGEQVAAFLEENTDFDEPVFASVATWEYAIGCCVPRPNLVGRGEGIHNYVPASVVGTRYRDYLAVVSGSSATENAAILAPYGFRYAVIHVRDTDRPGLAALAAGFEVRVLTAEYLVVDLQAPVESPAIPRQRR
jgi:hypothetical protein